MGDHVLLPELPRSCLEAIFFLLGSATSRRSFSTTCRELNLVARLTVDELVVPEDGRPDVLLSSRLHLRFPYCTTLTFYGAYRSLTFDHLTAFALHSGRPFLRRLRTLRLLSSRFAMSPAPAADASALGRSPEGRPCGLPLAVLVHLLKGADSSPSVPPRDAIGWPGGQPLQTTASGSSMGTAACRTSLSPATSGGINDVGRGGHGMLRELVLGCKLLVAPSAEDLQSVWRLVYPGSTLFLKRGSTPPQRAAHPAASLALAEGLFSAIASYAPHLHVLRIEQGSDVASSSSALRHLAALTRLETLRLYGSHLSPPSHDQGSGGCGGPGMQLCGLRCLPPLSRLHLEDFTLTDDLWRALAAVQLQPGRSHVSITASVGHLALSTGAATATTSGATAGCSMYGGRGGGLASAAGAAGAPHLPVIPAIASIELRDNSLYGPAYHRCQVSAVGHLLSLVPGLRELRLYLCAGEVVQQVAEHAHEVPLEVMVLRGVRAAAQGQLHRAAGAARAAAVAARAEANLLFQDVGNQALPPAVCYTDLLHCKTKGQVDIALADITDADVEALFGGRRLRARLAALHFERCAWVSPAALMCAVSAACAGNGPGHPVHGGGLVRLEVEGCHQLTEQCMLQAALLMGHAAGCGPGVDHGAAAPAAAAAAAAAADTAADITSSGGGAADAMVCRSAVTISGQQAVTPAVVRVRNCKQLGTEVCGRLRSALPPGVTLESGASGGTLGLAAASGCSVGMRRT